MRIDPHSSSDDHRKYRDESDLQAVNRRDPILRTERYLLAHETLTQDEMSAMRAEIKAAVDRAADEADAHPAPSIVNLMAHIYADDPVVPGTPTVPTYISSEPVAMIDAINHGLREELERNPKAVLWGEDIADPKSGVFGVTRGLSTAFPNRVFNAPLAEASIAGIAAGMAIGGYKPIIEIQFATICGLPRAARIRWCFSNTRPCTERHRPAHSNRRRTTSCRSDMGGCDRCPGCTRDPDGRQGHVCAERA